MELWERDLDDEYTFNNENVRVEILTRNHPEFNKEYRDEYCGYTIKVIPDTKNPDVYIYICGCGDSGPTIYEK